MQSKTILAVFCTIVVLFIGINANSTTKETPTLQGSLSKERRNVGSRSDWTTNISPESAKVFNDYKSGIASRLQMMFNIPTTFDPRPEKFATEISDVTVYHYLIRLPTNKYAYTTIFHRTDTTRGYGSGQNVNVRAQLYELNNMNI